MTQNACKRCRICLYRRSVDVFPCKPNCWEQEIPSSHKDTCFLINYSFLSLSFLLQLFQQVTSVQDASQSACCDLWHFLPPLSTSSSVCANSPFIFLLLEVPFLFPWQLGEWSQMTTGLPGAKVVDLMRCLHRLLEGWGGTSGCVLWEYHRHKKWQEESFGTQM